MSSEWVRPGCQFGVGCGSAGEVAGTDAWGSGGAGAGVSGVFVAG